ncbi:MAG: hypothetical protein HFJ52_01165 [Clostridia bacterium]|nr:hypothetical protein [Clostridia bacterium]
MENASKAVIIAGGVLISICVISIFYFMFRQIGDTVEVTQPNTAQKELKDFNTGFEAYNKKLMYGADIISVLNKAIDNNRRYKIEFFNNPKEPDYIDFYVNVIFTYEGKTYSLKDDFTEYTATRRNIIQKEFLDKVGLKETDTENIFKFKVSGFKCTRCKV